LRGDARLLAGAGVALFVGVARGGPVGDGLGTGEGDGVRAGLGARDTVTTDGAADDATADGDTRGRGVVDTAGGRSRAGTRRAPEVVPSRGAAGPGSTGPTPGTLSRDTPGAPKSETVTSTR
jgi:hypothetical protein